MGLIKIPSENFEMTVNPEVHQMMKFERVCLRGFSDILICMSEMQVRSPCKQSTFICTLYSTDLTLNTNI